MSAESAALQARSPPSPVRARGAPAAVRTACGAARVMERVPGASCDPARACQPSGTYNYACARTRAHLSVRTHAVPNRRRCREVGGEPVFWGAAQEASRSRRCGNAALLAPAQAGQDRRGCRRACVRGGAQAGAVAPQRAHSSAAQVHRQKAAVAPRVSAFGLTPSACAGHRGPADAGAEPRGRCGGGAEPSTA